MVDFYFLVGIFMVIISLTCLAGIILAFVYIKDNRKYQDQILTLEEFKMNMSYNPSDEDFRILDHIINEVAEEYKIFNFGFKEDLYINDKMQNKMIKDVLTQVMHRLSPITLSKLGLIYNQQYIEDIILKKIKIVVLDYTVEINGNYSS